MTFWITMAAMPMRSLGGSLMAGCSSNAAPTGPVQTQPTETEAPAETTAPVTYIDGVCFGTGEGCVGGTQAAVTVKDGAISSEAILTAIENALSTAVG